MPTIDDIFQLFVFSLVYDRMHDHQTLYKSKLPKLTERNDNPGSVLGPCELWWKWSTPSRFCSYIVHWSGHSLWQKRNVMFFFKWNLIYLSVDQNRMHEAIIKHLFCVCLLKSRGSVLSLSLFRYSYNKMFIFRGAIKIVKIIKNAGGG